MPKAPIFFQVLKGGGEVWTFGNFRREGGVWKRVRGGPREGVRGEDGSLRRHQCTCMIKVLALPVQQFGLLPTRTVVGNPKRLCTRFYKDLLIYVSLN